MLAFGRLAILPVILGTLTASSNAAIAAAVPQSELASFCAEFGASRIHLATFFMSTGLRLQGHVNCAKVTFTLSQILPPIE